MKECLWKLKGKESRNLKEGRDVGSTPMKGKRKGNRIEQETSQTEVCLWESFSQPYVKFQQRLLIRVVFHWAEILWLCQLLAASRMDRAWCRHICCSKFQKWGSQRQLANCNTLQQVFSWKRSAQFKHLHGYHFPSLEDFQIGSQSKPNCVQRHT